MIDWHHRIAPALRRNAVAAFAALSLVPSTGWAQSQYDVFGSGALAIAAYEASKGQCFYSDKMGNALADIDAFLDRQDAYRWEESKRLGPDGLIAMRNMARIQGASDCKVYGLAIGNAAIVYFNAAAFDEAVFAEFNRLLKGEGRSTSGEAEARPQQPPLPGSAADTIARLNGGRGIDNTPAAPPPQSSTLKRLPADDPPPTSLRSQPPPRQSAEPSLRLPRPPVAPLAQAAPTTAPPSLAPPNPAPPPAAPAASSFLDCRVAGDCRLAQPTFACNLDDAARIAAAGPDAGRQAGLAAVRAGSCEMVAPGRSLKVETTTAANVVYATEQGRHVGYLPVGVFAPAAQAGTTACNAPGFCAVRPGPGVWICPSAASLMLPSPEARRAAKCMGVSENVAAEVAPFDANTLALLNLRGGSPPAHSRDYVARADMVGLDLSPTPTPADRGWCRPDDWCVTPVAALFCRDRAADQRIMSLPPGEARTAAILAEPACRLILPGNPLKPKGLPSANDPRKLIEVEHPVLKAGWASANAFKVVAYTPPLRYTSQLSDFFLAVAKSPSPTAVSLSGQGTGNASGTFKSGPKERSEFCKDYWDENTSGFRSCLAEPDETMTVKADCGAKRISLDGRRYELRERPARAPDIHPDQSRQWLFWNVANQDWLDGTTVSGEATVGTAFKALCPGTDPEATSSLVYRDPRAAFPRELQGRWYDDRRACTDPRRTAPDYDEHGWMVITAEGRVGSREYEWPQRINAVRALGRGAWEIDGSHRIDDATVPEIFQSSTYRLTRDGFVLRQQGSLSEWVRCR